MRELASQIRTNLDALSLQYEQRLQEIDEYAQMPDQARLEAARSDILRIAEGLESGDPGVFTISVLTLATERVAKDFEVRTVQQALTALADVLEPLLDTVETANTLWRAMLDVHNALSEATMKKVQAAEERFRSMADSIGDGAAIIEDGQSAVTSEITGQEQTESALRQGEEEQRRILDSIPAMVWYKDTENRILRLNKAAARTMGRAVEDVEGRSVYDLNPAEAEDYHRDDLEVIESGKPKLGIIESLVTAAGETRWLQTDKIPYLDADGNIVGVIVFALDITERRRLEQSLKELLARRGRQVQASTEISQEIAAAPALDELYRRVVSLVKERFGYYHAQLFLLDSKRERLATVAGYGDVGRQLVEQRHSIPLGKGVVGRAGAQGRAVLSPDVSQDPEWLYHPLLPDTKGELAVPIRMRDEVLGVLDVQSDEAEALTEDDQILLEGLCGQIAVAIESTRLHQEMEESLHELERVYRAMSREGWESLRRRSRLTGYRFDQADVVPLADRWLSPEGEDVSTQVTEAPVYETPLSVRGEAFGILGIADDPENPLSEEELALVESVAEQVAQALESARLFEQSQTALAETEELYRASADLNAAQTYDDILSTLRSHTILSRADRGASLRLFDRPWIGEDMPEWILTAARWSSLPVEYDARYRLRDFPSASRLLRPDAPTVVTDVETDPRMDDGARALYAEGDGVRSTIVVPLVVGGQWLGYMDGFYAEQTAFPEAEVRRLMALASQAAVAVQSLRQLEETRSRAEREELILAITDRVRRSTKRETIMRTTLEEVGQMLGASRAVMRLGTKERLLAGVEPPPSEDQERQT